MKQLHDEFHSRGSRILSLAAGGHPDEALERLADHSQFPKVSKGLNDAMKRWHDSLMADGTGSERPGEGPTPEPGGEPISP